MLDRGGVESWLNAYDAAGIADDDGPPPFLTRELAQASIIVASDLRRALDTAARLAPNRSIIVSPLFRELPLPLPAWRKLRIPLAVWEAVGHIRWSVGIARGRAISPEARERVRLAAAWCRETSRDLTADGNTIAIITHGLFRHALAQELTADGWRPERGRRSYAHWSVWSFSTELT